MSSNKAAVLQSIGKPLVIEDRPYPEPKENEVVIKTNSIAVNPVDYKIQDSNQFKMKLPTVLGCDISGTVEQLGSSVTRFKKGDRVLAVTMGSNFDDQRRKGFQLYAAVPEYAASPIPDHIGFNDAAVLPLCIETAACGLFEEDHLSLPLPSVNPVLSDEVVLVWGGASSTGVNVIQLAKAAGYQVYATASPSNFQYLRRLGANEVFDYNSSSITQDIIRALSGKNLAGSYLASGDADSLFKVVQSGMSSRRVCSTLPKTNFPDDIVFSTLFAANSENTLVGRTIFIDFLPQALVEGRYTCAPSPHVVGKGLESLQGALDTCRKGVSAQKILVTL